MSRRIGLKPAEISAAFAVEELRAEFPVILDVPQVAKLLRLRSRKTVYFWVAQGRFDGTFRKRGKHLRFWRDRVIDRFFNGPDWETTDEP